MIYTTSLPYSRTRTGVRVVDVREAGGKTEGAWGCAPGQNAVLGTSFSTPGAPFLPKMSYFQSRGHNFD